MRGVGNHPRVDARPPAAPWARVGARSRIVDGRSRERSWTAAARRAHWRGRLVPRRLERRVPSTTRSSTRRRTARLQAGRRPSRTTWFVAARCVKLPARKCHSSTNSLRPSGAAKWQLQRDVARLARPVANRRVAKCRVRDSCGNHHWLMSGRWRERPYIAETPSDLEGLARSIASRPRFVNAA